MTFKSLHWKKVLPIPLVLLVLIITASLCVAGVRWTANGVALRKITGSDARFPGVVPAGNGAAIVAWHDLRNGWANLYARKVSAGGAPQWTANGVAIRNLAGSGVPMGDQRVEITTDGDGGAIICWQDDRPGTADIFAQRVDKNGVARWAANGVALRNLAAGSGLKPVIASDEAGGAIVAWSDSRDSAVNTQIYAQRVSGGGAVRWAPNGVAVRNLAGSESRGQVITTDGSGGAVIAWLDRRNTAYNVYAQKLNENGTALWAANGVALRNLAAGGTDRIRMISDGSGGAFVSWVDYRVANGNIYARRVDANGAPKWAANGVAIRDLPSLAQYQNLASDGSGGFIITWGDTRSGVYDVYAQRFDRGGAALWAANGVVLRNVAGSFAEMPEIVGDGSGGAIVTWADRRSGNYDIYAQMINSSGVVQCETNGMAVRNLAGTDSYWARLVTDGAGGAIVAYQDQRGGDDDIYAQRISSDYPNWYLAEGTTAWGFQTYITIQNPNSTAQKAKVTYMPTGAPNVSETVSLPANSQVTLTNDHLLEKMGGQRDFSTSVKCENAGTTIAVDRTMSWTGGEASGTAGEGVGTEAHNSIGVTSPAKTWYLPEGSSAWGFECWLLVQNPGTKRASVDFTYMIEGVGPQVVSHEVEAKSRATFNMENDVGRHDASVMLASNVPIIPERAMYRDSRREGHDSIGTTTQARSYYLAEGTTAWGFTTYVLIQNPGDDSNTVNVTYMTPEGPVDHSENPIVMPANSRKTIRVNDFLPGKDFSTLVSGSDKLIAERAMYWSSATGEACHDSVGMNRDHKSFYLPDGQSSDGRETWTLVQNANDSAVDIEVVYLRAGGGTPVVKNESVPANSRKTFNMLDHSGINGRAAIRVTCKTGAKRIMVERAMYWDARGAGTDTIGGYTD